MELYVYNTLETNSKLKLLYTHGVFLMTRIYDNFRINLYSIYGFFVEVWYNDDTNSTDKIRTFKSINALEPYLNKIKLNLKP